METVTINKCRAEELKCNGMVNPLGIERENLSFSWVFGQDGYDKWQSAYRILVSDSQESIDCCAGDIWDTGKVLSRKTNCISYEGGNLESRKTYYWRVCVWDKTNVQSGFGQTASFETGLFSKQDWTASWIGGFNLLRKEFNVVGKVKHARAYVSGLGYYELRINGRKAGDQVLSPSYTNYNKRTEYQTFDVGSYLLKGWNAVGIMLGKGWYKGERRAILQLEVSFIDGEILRVNTDETWKGSSGPVVSDSIFNGEIYDARKEKTNWDMPNYNDKGWKGIQVFERNDILMTPQNIPPIRKIKEIAPKSITRLDANTYIVDVGQNIAGWLKIIMSGSRGRKVVFKHSELLRSDGSVNQDNLRKAAATDTYILKGDGKEIYEPRFTYHGFRYAQIENYPGNLTIDMVKACLVHSDVEDIGSFSCSNKLFNKIHQAMKSTIRNNLHSIPTDCCQRDERQGWMGDGHIVSDSAVYNFDMHNFYIKWLDDILDLQDAITGDLECSHAPKWYEGDTSSIAWKAAYFIIVWNIYKYYDDSSILEKHFTNLKHLFSYWEGKERGGLLDFSEPYGDWLASKRTPMPHIANCFYFQCCRILMRMSAILGAKKEELYYLEKCSHIKQSYNNKFYNPTTGFYKDGVEFTQFGNAFPLFLDIVPSEEKAKITDNLIWDITKARGSTQLNTGILGTKYLMEVLSGLRMGDIIFDLFSRTEYPSWGFMMKNGATTIWERWDHYVGGEMNSHNHPALASTDYLFFNVFAGLSFCETNGEGYKFNLSPYFHEKLSSVNASIKMPWGTVKSNWKREKDHINMTISIPANSAAEVAFGTSGNDKSISLSLGSGDYSFDFIPDKFELIKRYHKHQ